ncbi:MAG TPA: aromatic-ring-hydroxylating dioxygenase subunit beta [Caulobacteraceae bacterium]|jgi:anthranilate 1,2-dioxygenase small subunit
MAEVETAKAEMDWLPEILKAQALYARCLDDGPLEAWPDFFTEDCFYKITTADNHRRGLEAGLIWADNRRMLQDRVSALLHANIYERQRYRHLLGLPLIGAQGDRKAECETPFVALRIVRDGATDVFASGRYLDRWRREGQGILLAQRIVVCDSSRIDTLLALPL